LSELIENILKELTLCIHVEEDDITPSNLGLISSFYYVNVSTIELFSSSLTNTTKLRGKYYF
jgi:pre-mRNA-splicing helicase BRR2